MLYSLIKSYHHIIFSPIIVDSVLCCHHHNYIPTGNGSPVFINETSDCTYVFEWATPKACPPFKVIECSYRDGTQQYDLASLASVEDNYKVMSNSGVDRGVYYVNLCRSLLHKKGVKGKNLMERYNLTWLRENKSMRICSFCA